MTDTEKVLHLRGVEDRLSRLTEGRALAFGLSCLDRMVPVYERASQGRAWGQPALLRSAVDSAWRTTSADRASLVDLATRCLGAVPPEEALLDAAAVAAHLVANAVVDLLSEAGSGHAASGHFTAARALELIEILEDEGHPEDVVATLLTSEVSRQRVELEGLEQLGAPREGASVLADHWFEQRRVICGGTQ